MPTGKSTEKEHFYQNFKGLLFLTGWSYGYHFWQVMKHLSVLSKKHSFATVVNIRQKLRQFKREKSLKLNDF